MSFVKTKQQAQTQNKVGSSYGERREMSQRPQARAIPQRPASQQPLDNFNSIRRGNPAGFAPNANFRKAGGRVQAPGIPHKRALHHHIEQGSAPISAPGLKQMPSNRALLNFLDRVISTPRKKSASNVSIKQKPLNKVEPRAQKVDSQVKPRLPRTGRPIPTIDGTRTNKA